MFENPDQNSTYHIGISGFIHFNGIEALSQLNYNPDSYNTTIMTNYLRTLFIATITPNININEKKKLLNTNIKIAGLREKVVK